MNPPTKIAYVVKRYPRFSETFIVNEILAHEAAGQALEIFSLGPCSDTHFQNVISLVRAPVTYLPAEAPKSADLWRAMQDMATKLPGGWAALDAARGELIRDVNQALVLALMARQRGITHLHAHFATSATTVARLAAHLAGISYSFTAHAKDIFHESVDATDLRRKLVEASACITVSDFNLEFLREQFGDDARNVTRLFNGIHLSQFPYAAPTNRPPLIAAVGRLVEKKGFDVLVAASAELVRRGVNFRCQIAGGGEHEAALREQIAALNVQSHVELIGPRPQSEIISLVQGAAALAAPCVVGNDGNRDGLPTVLFEAMALGTPCVSTDVTGIPEVLRDQDTGLLVPQRDPIALADALQKLINDSALRVRLAAAARELMEAEFDITRNSVRQRAIFAHCIAGQRVAAEVCQPEVTCA